MLAIYASEKALRLAERLGEVRAASRAHGIFGRVFGRIGDTVKARENLERAVELARGSDAHETVLALMALGHHLESSDGDYAGAAGAYREALTLAQQIGDVPAEIELHAAVAQLALYAADWEEVVRSQRRQRRAVRARGPDRKALPSLRPSRTDCTGAAGEWQESESSYSRAHELAEQIGWSEVCFDALYGLSNTLRDQGELAGAETALSQALDVCERAGLIVQSIQANSARPCCTASRTATRRQIRPHRRRSSSPSACAIPLARQPRSKPPASSGPFRKRSLTFSAPARHGRASAARWRPPAASCCSGNDCSRTTAKPLSYH